MSEIRDAIRAKMFDKENTKPKSKEFVLFGQKVEMRQPSIEAISRLTEAGTNDQTPALVRMMIEYIYVPDTDEKVFDKADAEQLSKMPSGPWLTAFNGAFEELTSLNVDSAEKNSEKTA